MASQNAITAGGISIQTQTDIINLIVNGNGTVPGLVQIYGSGINVGSNTPDGQLINIFALAKLDIEQFCVAIYNSQDPDQAVGNSLDALAQLCGITRQGGTYTTLNLTVTTSTAVALNGLDTSTPYTVQDSIGNQYYLLTSTTTSTGANNLVFRAANIGAVQSTVNTITIPVTVVAGVTSINNPYAPTVVGANQETDSSFRIRRQASVALASTGNYAGLLAALYSIPGTVQAIIKENITNSTDSNSTPPHTIWTIVDSGTSPGTLAGTAYGTSVANAIYTYRSMGCAMRGGQLINITQADSSTFGVQFDYAIYQNLYIKFTSSPIVGASIDKTALANGLAALYTLSIYQTADITTITALLKQINTNALITNCQVSTDNTNWYNSVVPSSVQNRFVVYAANITSS